MNFDQTFFDPLLEMIDNIDKEMLIKYLLNKARDMSVDETIVNPLKEFVKQRFPGSQANPQSFEEMQSTFNKLLGKELQSPGTYSLITANRLAEMNRETCDLFKDLCSISMVAFVEGTNFIKKHEPTDIQVNEIDDIRVFYFDTHRGTSISNFDPYDRLKKYGFNREKLRLLDTYGLISIEHGNFFRGSVKEFWFGNTYWFINSNDQFSFHKFAGIPFTLIGKELFTLVNFEFNELYFQDLNKFFNKNRQTLREMKVHRSLL